MVYPILGFISAYAVKKSWGYTKKESVKVLTKRKKELEELESKAKEEAQKVQNEHAKYLIESDVK
jgi:prefoldin subunit 5